MKHKILSMALILLIILSLTLFGCNAEKKYTAEEWESISKASETTIIEKTVPETINNQLAEELEKIKMSEEILQCYNAYVELNNNFNDNLDKHSEYNLANLESSIDYTHEYIRALNGLKVPKPLDNFYDLVLTEANTRLNMYYQFIYAFTDPKNYSESKSNEYIDELQELNIEIKSEFRKVAREYNLESE